jgi:hypothetical protein
VGKKLLYEDGKKMIKLIFTQVFKFCDSSVFNNIYKSKFSINEIMG